MSNLNKFITFALLATLAWGFVIVAVIVASVIIGV